MRKNVESGIVAKVDQVSPNLTFLTLRPIADEGWISLTLPIYMSIPASNVENRAVDIITVNKGFLGRTLSQEVLGSNFSYSVEISQSRIDSIIAQYKGIR